MDGYTKQVWMAPLRTGMRAWHLVVGPLAVTSAVCISVFVCVVVLAKVVIAEVTFLLFCGSSCFSCRSLGSQIEVWCFSPQFRHLPFERH